MSVTPLISRSAPATLVAALLAALALAGCELKQCADEETGEDGVCLDSLERFEGDPISQSAAYTSDVDLVVENPNGDLHVVRGDSDRIAVTFEPFVLRGQDVSRDEAEEDLEELEVSLSQSARAVLVEVRRPSGAPATLGADVRIELPDDFASVLDVNQRNGNTRIEFVGAAPGVIVTSDNGDCDLVVGRAERISVHCDNGDLRARVQEPAPQSGSGFSTGNGSIDLLLPPNGVFNVQAQALGGGVVLTRNVPSSCWLAPASDASKTLGCNGASGLDPIYSAVADGTALADVVLRF